MDDAVELATEKSEREMIVIARSVRERAYCGYSKFAVGAALEAESGKFYAGCNVENLSFGLTICAERNAVFAAVAAGERRFRRIVVISDSKEPVSMCGACRQVLAEFGEDLEVLSVNLVGDEFRSNLRTLLPRAKTGILDAECST